MGSDEKAFIHVEVAYATPEEQVIIPLCLEQGATLLDAIKVSGVLERFPAIDLERQKTGIFSKVTKPDTVLREHDRIEIYRPLIADPKAIRKQRAAAGKKMRKGGAEKT